MSVQSIRTELPRLSNVDLLDLRQRIDCCIQNGADKPEAALAKDDDWLTAGFCSELRRRGILTRDRTAIAVKHAAPKDYAVNAARIRDHMLGYAPRQLSEQELLALGRICGKVLAVYLQHRQHFGLKAMLYSVGLVPEAFDNAYPSYLECGLMGMLLNQPVGV